MKKVARDKWHLYILACRDGSFYTGITNDLERRMEMHKMGRASKYTRSRQPVRMVHAEACEDRSDALRKEATVKALSRREKEEYVRCHGE